MWKKNPSQACTDTYQPGISDHDYELMFPAGSSPATQTCTAEALSSRFTDPGTQEPRDITLPDGSTIAFADVTFFPFSRTDFENARRAVETDLGHIKWGEPEQ